jgi:hypothetical protein
MKCWQAVYCFRLGSIGFESQLKPFTPRQMMRLVFIQLTIAPWKFVALPVALLITLPFGWCYAFFHSITCMGTGEDDLRGSVARTWYLSTLGARQNHVLIFILSLFSTFVFANVSAAVYSLPILLKSLLGVESILSRSSSFLMNSTFWVAMAALTYLSVNPLILAVYVLRCRDGASLATGHDLLAELNRLAAKTTRCLPLLLFALTFFMSAPGLVSANEDPSIDGHSGISGVPAVITPERLDSAIQEVMQRIELTWKLPREDSTESLKSEEGFLVKALDVLLEWARKGWEWAKLATRQVLKWLGDWISEDKRTASGTSAATTRIVFWMFLVLFVLVAAGAALARRRIKRKCNAPCSPHDQPESDPSQPDLGSEDLLPDELPLSRWLSLAGELLARGEARSAIRALHLASMAHLADKGLVSIARSKSNREYLGELKRRGHTLPMLVEAFSHNTLTVEKVWYGTHAIEGEMLDRFLMNQKLIMADAHEK